MSTILDALSTPIGSALFMLCALAAIVGGVFFGVARGERDRADAMRTADREAIERQTRALRRKASDARP